jgi:hypothetical protein
VVITVGTSITGFCDAGTVGAAVVFLALVARASAAARRAACKSPAGAGSEVATAGVKALTDPCAIVSKPPTMRCDMIKLVGVTSSPPSAAWPGPGDKDSMGAGAEAPSDTAGRANTAAGGPAALAIMTKGGPAAITAKGGPPQVGGGGGPPQTSGIGGPAMTLGGGADMALISGPETALGALAAATMTDGGGPPATATAVPHCEGGLTPGKIGPVATGAGTAAGLLHVLRHTTGGPTAGMDSTGARVAPATG